ncbi:tetratricopeptide repeat protein [Tengunoibacter tsumagoiensis]|uniref:Alpha-L-rhamnosidase six-hairpin glycosidase domain-containing protein n=1 Tax=Tengunoibacter tsumagoiensis TaxID=2014871 RepID=A0A402A6F9_9CHLR|nr:tetratricopeptide repeat protein [Tengunoibacter tsumagoiensis]GCE14679.1 hypothetical protein KTT_45380 [Tengunoibacter tsumagoiensis]
MKLAHKYPGEALKPLERVTLIDIPTEQEGSIVVRDGLGREYARLGAHPTLEFTIAGAGGIQSITFENTLAQVQEKITFLVQATTELHDQDGFYTELLQMLYYTMFKEVHLDYNRYNGKVYHFFICWLRDHVHVLKGKKYFANGLKSAIELYRDSQREDGMIWDNIYDRSPEPNFWDTRFAKGDFIRQINDGHSELKRIPVENDVEYLFVEGLYYTWKATNDSGWMSTILDAAIQALDYTINSPYRWSDKYQLLKRGYTIDTWDFQTEADSAAVHDAMQIDLEKTHFGVMFGDNTGYAASCDYLAEMLAHIGRLEEAERFRQRADAIRQRLNEVSWNGRFFTHHVPEHPERKRDLGVDESTQVSLSNSYSINRHIEHDQATAIIETYLGIKEQLPEGSPGEWYTIYPPFLKGFGGHNGLWQYMNGGVVTIVAGELAHGAFQHGYEAYAVDILQRIHALGKKHGSRYHNAYTGSLPAQPVRSFTPLDISSIANIDVAGAGADGVPGWTGEGDNDFHTVPTGEQTLAEIPFLIPDPATNHRRAAIGLSQRQGYVQKVTLPVHSTARSIYFLHTVAHNIGGGVSGKAIIKYADGSAFTQYIVRGYNAQGWWLPEQTDPSITRVAWRGENAYCKNIGLLAYGLANPHPEREIAELVLEASETGAFWGILGITLGAEAVSFPTNPISFGIPDGWGAAAIVYALVEGLVGIVDETQAYQQVTLAPRWTATTTTQVSTTITYPESGGYLAYAYHHDQQRGLLTFDVAGSGERCNAHILLPAETGQAISVKVNGQEVDFVRTQVEQSYYVDFQLPLTGVQQIQITYAPLTQVL